MLEWVWAPGPTPPPTVELDGDTALHSAGAGTVVLLNRSAAAVLRLVDGRRRAGELVALLAEQHGSPPEALRDDVLAVLQDLSAAGLLRAPAELHAGGLAVDALGTRLVVAVEDDALRAALADVLADLRTPADEEALHPSLVVVRGTGPWQVSSPVHAATARTREQALHAALAALNLSAVRSCPHLALHAAVLARDDRTLVLPGRSGLGKTTLTAALLRTGWQYVSDEALLLPWEGSLAPLPYPRPLALSDWSCRALGLPVLPPGAGERVLRAAELGASVRRDPRPVTDVVLVHREEGMPPGLRTVPRSSALPELFARGFTTAADPARALHRLRDLLAGATVRRLDLGLPADSARLLDLS